MMAETFPSYLDQFLDFQGSDEDFVQLLKRLATQFIGQYIGEVEDGFIEGLNDILPFIQENLKALIRVSCDPSKAPMAEMMGVPPIMAFVNRAYADYQKMKTE